MVYATVLDIESNGAIYLTTNTVFPDKIELIKMDVTNEGEIQMAFDYVCEDLKSNGHKLWGLVNNAGIFAVGFIDWGTMDSYRRVFDVNLFGLVCVTRTFLPLIRESKGLLK